MDLTVFSNLNVMWTRWSEYTLTTCEMSGPHISYLVPAPGPHSCNSTAPNSRSSWWPRLWNWADNSWVARQTKTACVPLSRSGTAFWDWMRTGTQPMRMIHTCPRIATR